MSASSSLTLQRIDEAFLKDRIPPVPISFHYRLTLALVAMMMVLLPLVYLALIAGVAWLTWWHATHDADIFLMTRGGKSGLVALFLYLTPIFVGAVALFFMVKPLFARRPKTNASRTLRPGEQPVLEHFIQRVCRAVGAPEPRAIEVDCNVNAAAALRRGFWSLFGKDLKLIIGLPVVAGMDVKCFGGVLAHEFGHFAQGAGMRLTYLIRSINGWFARVVFERDAWDLRLESAAKNSPDWRLQIVVQCCRGMVWLSRRILHGLMLAGHAISCWAMRQMEFDADRHEARFSGSEVFGVTCRRLHELGLGMNLSVGLLQRAYGGGRLARNVPDMARQQADALSGDIQEAINKRLAEGKTKLFDTHPCDQERIRSAEKDGAPGIFSLEAPASSLFVNFDEFCEGVTRHYYSEVQEIDVSKAALVDNETLLAEAKTAQGRGKALDRVFHGGLNYHRPLVIEEEPPADLDLAAARALLEQELPTARPEIERFADLSCRIARALKERDLTSAGFRVTDALKGSVDDLKRRRAVSANMLGKYDHFASAIASHALKALPEADSWRPVFKAIQGEKDLLAELGDLVEAQQVLVANVSPNGVQQGHLDRMNANRARMQSCVDRLRVNLGRVAYPLPHKDPSATLATLFTAHDAPTEPILAALQIAGKGLDGVWDCWFHGLAALAEQVETLSSRKDAIPDDAPEAP